MKITAIKTHKVTKGEGSLLKFIETHIQSLPNYSILSVTSKVVSILEGNTYPIKGSDKSELIKNEADYYLPKPTQYGFILTIKNNILVPTSGIDESNGNGLYIPWPKNPQKSANTIREFLVKTFKKKYIGVIITDSKTTPLRWGTTGVCIAHSGFHALNNYIGKKDIFGRTLEVTKANIYDALASASVLVMGEGNEQTPLSLISDVSFISFTGRNPTKKELNNLSIDINKDLYSEILTSVNWVKGKKISKRKTEA